MDEPNEVREQLPPQDALTGALTGEMRSKRARRQEEKERALRVVCGADALVKACKAVIVEIGLRGPSESTDCSGSCSECALCGGSGCGDVSDSEWRKAHAPDCPWMRMVDEVEKLK